MVDYVRALALAQRLIGENGRLVMAQKLSATPADASKPWEGPAAPTVEEDMAVFAAFVTHAGNRDLSELLVDKELLARCELLCLVPASDDYDLKDYNQVVDGLITYKISFMRIVAPGPTRLLYVFGLSQ